MLREPVCLCSTTAQVVELPLVDAEHQLLAGIIRAPALLDEVPGLEPADFTRPPHIVLMEAIRNLQHVGRAISVETLHQYMVDLDIVRGTVCRLHSGELYIRALLSTDSTPPTARDAGHVRAWAGLLRRIRHEREESRR